MSDTELHFLGDATLARGFRLAGFEVHPDIDETGMERLLRRLQSARRRAFVILDDRLAASSSEVLAEVRTEGGNILLSQVPPFNQPGALTSPIDERIEQMLGGAK